MKLSDGTPVSPRLRWAGKEELVPVREMTTKHILHAKEYCDRRAIAEDYDDSEPYRGYSYGEWSEIFALELERRDQKTRAYRKQYTRPRLSWDPQRQFGFYDEFDEFDGDVPEEVMW